MENEIKNNEGQHSLFWKEFEPYLRLLKDKDRQIYTECWEEILDRLFFLENQLDFTREQLFQYLRQNPSYKSYYIEDLYVRQQEKIKSLTLKAFLDMLLCVALSAAFFQISRALDGFLSTISVLFTALNILVALAFFIFLLFRIIGMPLYELICSKRLRCAWIVRFNLYPGNWNTRY